MNQDKRCEMWWQRASGPFVLGKSQKVYQCDGDAEAIIVFNYPSEEVKSLPICLPCLLEAKAMKDLTIHHVIPSTPLLYELQSQFPRIAWEESSTAEHTVVVNGELDGERIGVVKFVVGNELVRYSMSVNGHHSGTCESIVGAIYGCLAEIEREEEALDKTKKTCLSLKHWGLKK